MTDDETAAEDWWVRGWLLGKYGQEEPLPQTAEDAAEWLDGYKRGRAENGRFDGWRAELRRDHPEILDLLER